MKILKSHVVADARRQEEKRKKRVSAQLHKYYSKSRKVEFPKQQISMDRHFYCPKLNGNDQHKLSTSALAVYPVLCSLADFEKDEWFYASQQDIARMAGIKATSVRKALKELTRWKFDSDSPLLQMKKETKGKTHYYVYRVAFIRHDMIDSYKGVFFIFYTSIVDSGLWAQLSTRAKALYLSLRSNATFDWETYVSIEEIENPLELTEAYKTSAYRKRKWDICLLPMAELCKNAGISARNITDVVSQLEKYKLVARYDSYYLVYLQPSSTEFPII